MAFRLRGGSPQPQPTPNEGTGSVRPSPSFPPLGPDESIHSPSCLLGTVQQTKTSSWDPNSCTRIGVVTRPTRFRSTRLVGCGEER